VRDDGESLRIDAHQHFWRVARGDYDWMPAGPPLRRDYLPEDLRPLNQAAGFDGSIVVQAAQTVAETEWLLNLAVEDDPAILGVVGWARLDGDADAMLARLGDHPKGGGVRPMLQDLGEDDWIWRRVPQQTLHDVAAQGLVFDVLSYPRHLPWVRRALERVDDLVVVIDHLSKPSYREALGGWRDDMRALAARPQTFCKLSGLVTEVSGGWSIDDFRRHVDIVIEAFGPERMLFGTDWPVCLLAAKHAEVVRLAEVLTADLGPLAQAQIFGSNAKRVYGV
jgi:L-fuconolactonase